MYFSSKILKYKNSKNQKNGTIYKKEDKVYFIFEQLTEENYEFWDNYANIQDLAERNFHEFSTSGFGIGIGDGIKAFIRSIKLLPNTFEESYEIWISYATRKNPLERSSFSHEDIEMSFAVFASKNIPITTHIGIFRNYKYFQINKKPHIDLSLELHAFSAFISKIIYQNVKYTVTKPTMIMRKILLKALNQEDEIWVGSSTERNHLKKQNHHRTENILKNLFKNYKNIFEPPIINSENRKVKWLIEINNNMISFKEPHWFRVHANLGKCNHIPTVIVSISALENIWTY
jgi:hypothetical protein